jgi:hypothetical protein
VLLVPRPSADPTATWSAGASARRTTTQGTRVNDARGPRRRALLHLGPPDIKGPPDVLAGRSDRFLGGTEILPLDDAAREGYARGNRELAEQGMRVLAIGARPTPSRPPRIRRICSTASCSSRS